MFTESTYKLIIILNIEEYFIFKHIFTKLIASSTSTCSYNTCSDVSEDAQENSQNTSKDNNNGLSSSLAFFKT